MKALLPVALALAAATACVVGADFIVRRIVLWALTLLVALMGAGCTFALTPGDKPHLRVCMPPRAFMCDARYEGSEM